MLSKRLCADTECGGSLMGGQGSCVLVIGICFRSGRSQMHSLFHLILLLFHISGLVGWNVPLCSLCSVCYFLFSYLEKGSWGQLMMMKIRVKSNQHYFIRSFLWIRALCIDCLTSPGSIPDVRGNVWWKATVTEMGTWERLTASKITAGFRKWQNPVVHLLQ